MLRFRNRFSPKPSGIGTCGCGRRISYTLDSGRETFIHETPWCAEFRAIMERVERRAAEEGIELHQALVAPEERVTMVVADADSVKDLDDAGVT